MNKEAKYRADIYARELGCIVCRVFYNIQAQPADLHHPAPGMKRISDSVFMPLCEWHHRGVCRNTATVTEMEALLGPSLARDKDAFIAAFATEEELLEMTEEVYHLYRSLSKT